MTYRIDRITVAPLPPMPTRASAFLPEWAQPAVRTPVIQPWSENQRRFAIGVGDDAGNVGWFGPVGGSVAMIVGDQLLPVVTGLDVRAWRAFIDLRPAGRHSHGAHARMAVSAVELAAWDLRSHLMNTTVESILGGGARKTVPAYATALGIDIDHPLAPDVAAWIAEQGFWGQKWGLPGHGRDEPPAVDAARLDRLRGAIGDHARLCIDACGSWNRAYTRQMLPVLAEHRVTWVEEPGAVDPADLAGFGVPCAAGEHDYDLASQLVNLEHSGLHVWQPEPAWNGGLAHSVRLVELAGMRGIPCFPHGTALAVALRLAALMPCSTVPAVEYHLTLEPLRQAVYQEPLEPAGGQFSVDERPGLGSPYCFPTDWEDPHHAA